MIIGAYRWLSDHYQPGDEIFLFGTMLNIKALYEAKPSCIIAGFSRGAYQVRALAGMIETVGKMH